MNSKGAADPLGTFSMRWVLFILALLFGLSLPVMAAYATDCPPGYYADCVAVVSSPWNPLVPVIGSIFGAGVAGWLAGGKPSPAQFGEPGGPRTDVSPGPPPAAPPEQPVPPMQLESPGGQPATSSLPTSGPAPDSFPEEPVPHVTLEQEGPPPPPPRPPPPPPEMRATSNWVRGPDGNTVRLVTGAGPIGQPHNDGTPGDGRYEDRQGNPVQPPAGYNKTGEVIFKTALQPGLFSSGNPITDEFFYAGTDTLPGTGIPGTPSTTEMADPRVRYKRIVYDNTETGFRITYVFYRNEGSLMNPFIDEGTYRIASARMVRIPK